MYIMDLRFKAAVRASNEYRKSLERFSKGYPSIEEAEIQLDLAFEGLCLELKSPGMRELLESVLNLQEEAVAELELGLNREEMKHAVEIERRISRQAGLKNRTANDVFDQATKVPEQLRLFNDSDALIAALHEHHIRAKLLINKSRKLDRAVKKKMKKNVRQAAASSSFAVIMFVGNFFAFPALLTFSGAAGFIAVHSAWRDLSE
ncbi:MAG: hypothetical protein KJ875_15530 [Alphaproteobacteria bacterium]|nr:hypothetical protein [Alphaproteobacteria bacterium]MBU2162317.1 hypothetical protein [Alphaproteobacteria bacterium]MBU2243619.1 hypothetical protein [Alphaproteobacteria bacterium]